MDRILATNRKVRYVVHSLGTGRYLGASRHKAVKPKDTKHKFFWDGPSAQRSGIREKRARRIKFTAIGRLSSGDLRPFLDHI